MTTTPIDQTEVYLTAKEVRDKIAACQGGTGYTQFRKWTEGKEGQEREDNNEWLNDLMDGNEYADTRHMIKLMKATK